MIITNNYYKLWTTIYDYNLKYRIGLQKLQYIYISENKYFLTLMR